jgi:predicted metalloprotease
MWIRVAWQPRNTEKSAEGRKIMRWRKNRKSSHVEDRRGVRASGSGSMGGGSGMLRLLPMVFKFLGFKGTLILAVCVGAYALFTGNLGNLLGGLGLQKETSVSRPSAPFHETAQEKELVDFVSVILADTEDTWTALFRQMGKTYKEPRLVLFRDAVDSACGMAQSAMGPFYCPGDQQVYIDLGFFDQLKNRFKAPGDFAQAYVIAHEVGHHIQTLLGISNQVHAARGKLSTAEGNNLSVLHELQADCLAGVWAHHANRTRQLLDVGDLEEGLTAASAIGDDTLQKQSQGYVSPDSFTHGSSAQRVKWFKIGWESGDMASCDTFNNRE